MPQLAPLTPAIKDTGVYQLCTDLTACGLRCPAYCEDAIISSCDSINSVNYVYKRLLAFYGETLDTALMDDVYSIMYGQSIPYAAITAITANCNNDTAVLTQITYSARNLSYSTDSLGRTFIDFDLFATDTPTNLLFSQGNIFVQYDSTVFGTSLVANGLITASKGNAVDSPYYNLVVSDSTPTMLKLSITHTPNPTSLANLDNVNQQLCHLKINLTGFNLTTVAAAFDTIAMAGRSMYQQTPSGLEFPYDIIRINGLVGASRSVDDDITFSIVDAVIDSTQSYLDFDVLASTELPYVGAAVVDYRIIINCDRYAFDSIGVDNSLGYGDNGYGVEIYNFGYYLNQGQITIELSANDSFNINSGYQAPDCIFYDSTSLIHVRLHIADCGEVPTLAIDATNTYADWDTINDITGYPTAYSPVYIADGYDNGGYPICTPSPKIEGWSPECTNAGSFEVTTITGRHFGSTTGTVFFTSADDTTQYISTLPQDIIDWNDNQIQLLIPSFPEDIQVAASGHFYIEAANGTNDIADSERISIGYANHNKRNRGSSTSSTDYMKPMFVYYSDTTFEFRADSALFNTPGAMGTISQILTDLNCRTGFYFRLGTGSASSLDTAIPDRTHLIRLKPYSQRIFSDTNTLIFTDFTGRIQSEYNGLPAYNNWSCYVTDVDITIRSDLPNGNTWNWNGLAAPGSTQVDFLTAMEHEIMHAALLCHTQPKDNGANIMYPNRMLGYQNPNYGSDPDDLLGILNVLSLGRTIGASDGIPGMLRFYGCVSPQPPAGCTLRVPVTGINEILPGSTFDVSLYPNPYQENTIIHIDVSQYSDFTISMYNMIGQLILQRNISSSTSFDVPLSDFDKSAGMYVIEVSDAHDKQTLKMIKINN